MTERTTKDAKVLPYPGPPLGPQLRDFSETRGIFALVNETFFVKAKEGG